MKRERREVGKGVRGVVQFRVGITLDFRGDVATSAALFPLTTAAPLPSTFSTVVVPLCLVFCRFYVPGSHPPT